MLGPQTQYKGAVYGDDEYFTSKVFSADYHPRAIGASRGPSSSERPPRPMQGRACALQKQRNADSVIVHCLSITATTDVVSASVSEQTDAYTEPPGTPGMYDDDADNGTPQALARRTDRDTTGPRWTGSPNVSSRTTGLSPPEETTVGFGYQSNREPPGNRHARACASQAACCASAPPPVAAAAAPSRHASRLPDAPGAQEHEVLEERKKNAMAIAANLQKRLGIAKRPLVSPFGRPAMLTSAGLRLRWLKYRADALAGRC